MAGRVLNTREVRNIWPHPTPELVTPDAAAWDPSVCQAVVVLCSGNVIIFLHTAWLEHTWVWN